MRKKKSGTTARRVLDVIADILTILALTTAGIGHLGPWFHVSDHRSSYRHGHYTQRDSAANADDRDAENEKRVAMQNARRQTTEVQAFYASRSGIALGASAFFVFLSLVAVPGVRLRKILVVFIFLSAVVAMVFQVLPFSPYNDLVFDRSTWPDHHIYEDWGLIMSMIATGIAGGLSLIRMTWTMTASQPRHDQDSDIPLAGSESRTEVPVVDATNSTG